MSTWTTYPDDPTGGRALYSGSTFLGTLDSAALSAQAAAAVNAQSTAPAPAPVPTPVGYGPDWGQPVAQYSDEFTYTGAPDPAKWELPPSGGWPGNGQNGRRVPSAANVANGILTLSGDSAGNTAWCQQRLATTFGRWKIRMRSRNTGTSGREYHVLNLVWPSSNRWPQDGEYDFTELQSPDANDHVAFLHYPAGNVQQEYSDTPNIRANDWHEYAYQWAPSGLTCWIDGVQAYHFTNGATSSRSNIQAMPGGHMTLQLDMVGSAPCRSAVMEIEYVRFYGVPSV